MSYIATPSRSTLPTSMKSRFYDSFQPRTWSELAEHAGMSSRPAYYSGRGVNRGDLGYRELTCIYRYLEAGASQRHFPETAPEGFISMVLSIEILSATAFLNHLRDLANNGWVWYEAAPKEQHIAVDRNEDGSPGPGAMAQTLFGIVGKRERNTRMETRETKGFQRSFLAKIDQSHRMPPRETPEVSEYCWGAGWGEDVSDYDEWLGEPWPPPD